MNLIRKYKIAKITNKPIEGVEGKAIRFIERWLDNLTPFSLGNNQYVTHIFYMDSDGNYVFGRDINFNNVTVRKYGFWDVLEEEYEISKTDIQNILKYLINNKYKRKTITFIEPDYRGAHQILEEEYQNYRNELNKKIQNIKTPQSTFRKN